MVIAPTVGQRRADAARPIIEQNELLMKPLRNDTVELISQHSYGYGKLKYYNWRKASTPIENDMADASTMMVRQCASGITQGT